MPADSPEAVLGARVRALRIERGLSQRELAAMANLSVGAIQHLESGTGATVRTLVRSLEALDARGWLDAVATPPAGFSPLRQARQERLRSQAEQQVPRVRRSQRAGGAL